MKRGENNLLGDRNFLATGMASIFQVSRRASSFSIENEDAC